jgi:lipopolysaccharide/colanic/teichoic acid biosynthesis glycosyltransferase
LELSPIALLILAGSNYIDYDTPILSQHIAPYYFSVEKRIFDMVTSFMVIWWGYPLFLLIAIAIFLTDGWPVFYFQKRVGKDGHPFIIYKYRTMMINAEQRKRSLWKKNEAPWPMFKLQNDPRYTKIGRFLSRSGLDELPQFLNIFLGDMSLVGPRPLPVSEAAKLDPTWQFRTAVRPGLISEWAINAKRYQSLAMWKKLDKKTLRQGSLQGDVKIMVKTLVQLLGNF